MPPQNLSLLLRALLVAAAGIVGIALGGIVGAAAAQDAEALVAGAIVAMGAILGGAAGLLAGGLASWKLDARKARFALWILGMPAIALLALAARQLWLKDQETRDPEHAFAGLPVFVATLERDPKHDPVLATRVQVDALSRRWSLTLADGRICTGRLRAAVQRRVSTGLPTTAEQPDACIDAAPAGPLERVTWRIQEGSSGAAQIDQACRSAEPQLQRLAALLAMAPNLATSAPSCERL
jgi:pimeloyl-ACP methyl ester carboxylesterase